MLSYAGIDVGSSYIKCVFLNEQSAIESYSIVPSGGSFKEATSRSFKDALKKAYLEEDDIAFIISTGYGRNSVSFANKSITEITCHAFGAKKSFPECGTVIDLGGQDSKVIHVNDKGYPNRFVMNDKCAAGTGRFLEVMSRALEIDLNEMGNMYLRSQKELEVSSVCTVFAESEVISLLSQGNNKIDIAAAIYRSIGRRLLGLISQIGIKEKVVMTGGVAQGVGIPAFLRKHLNTEILIPKEPQINGAFGAASIALEMGHS